jgi:hypothetical protein
MNGAFTNKIFQTRKALVMQSRTEEFRAELEPLDVEHRRPRSFELYEEYRQCNIIETIRMRRDQYDKAGKQAKRELITQAEEEVEDFRAWLIETKSLEPTNAHYYSVSLKSLLVGIPKGVQIAKLFDNILDKQANSTH